MNSRIKTKKGAAKRFKITSSGKLLKRGGYSSHLKKKKNKRRIRRQKELSTLSQGDKKRLAKLIS